MKYTCERCGKVHEEWPALTFSSPTAYNVLPEKIKQQIGELTSDFCVIRHPEQTDRFIRGTLTLKVIDHCEDLEYGLWVSLSEKSFQDYSDNYNNPDYEAKYFGWLSNDISEYEVSGSIPTTVFTRQNGLRPEIVPHEDFDHQLVHDYFKGINKSEAEKRIKKMLEVVNKRDKKTVSAKRWWRL